MFCFFFLLFFADGSIKRGGDTHTQKKIDVTLTKKKKRKMSEKN